MNVNELETLTLGQKIQALHWREMVKVTAICAAGGGALFWVRFKFFGAPPDYYWMPPLLIGGLAGASIVLLFFAAVFLRIISSKRVHCQECDKIRNMDNVEQERRAAETKRCGTCYHEI